MQVYILFRALSEVTCALQVWQLIAGRVQPVLQAVPMLRMPIDFVKRAFDHPAGR